MNTTFNEIVDYWSAVQSECGLSVDWAEARRLCWRCAQARKLQRCHIVPRALGGTEDPSNLVLLCKQCHAEAPNVTDPEFIWVWLRAHAASCYGTYWQIRGFEEYELVYGSKPFAGLADQPELVDRMRAAMKKHLRSVSTHWGQGKLNPATVAWVLRQVESACRNDANPSVEARPTAGREGPPHLER